MNKISDNLGDRCRVRTLEGKRCSRSSQWIIEDICISRANWLEAIKTGWPQCVRGMKSPEYHRVGFCRWHGNKYDHNKPIYIYGIGKVGSVKDKKDQTDYEEACKARYEHVAKVWKPQSTEVSF